MEGLLALIRMFHRMGIIYDEGPFIEQNRLVEKGEHGLIFNQNDCRLRRIYKS